MMKPITEKTKSRKTSIPMAIKNNTSLSYNMYDSCFSEGEIVPVQRKCKQTILNIICRYEYRPEYRPKSLAIMIKKIIISAPVKNTGGVKGYYANTKPEIA